MVKNIRRVKECPDCAGTDLVYLDSRDQVVCKDCGLVYEPLAPESRGVVDVTQVIKIKEREIGSLPTPVETVAKPKKKIVKKKPKKKAVKKKKKVVKKKIAKKKVAKKKAKKATKKKAAARKKKIAKKKPAKKKAKKAPVKKKKLFSFLKRLKR